MMVAPIKMRAQAYSEVLLKKVLSSSSEEFRLEERDQIRTAEVRMIRGKVEMSGPPDVFLDMFLLKRCAKEEKNSY